MTNSTFTTKLLDPHYLFMQDIIANPELAPQLSEPDRTPIIKAYTKGTFPARPPDISTPRTDVYILGLEENDPNDPFYTGEDCTG